MLNEDFHFNLIGVPTPDITFVTPNKFNANFKSMECLKNILHS